LCLQVLQSGGALAGEAVLLYRPDRCLGPVSVENVPGLESVFPGEDREFAASDRSDVRGGRLLSGERAPAWGRS